MNQEHPIQKFNPIFYKIVKNAIENNKISHAYLLSGNKNQDLDLESSFLIKEIVNSFSNNEDRINDPRKYADFYELGFENKEIKKEEMLHAINKLQETPLSKNGIKVLLINNIDRCNKYSLNSLLKFLEEPTKKTYIIMNTSVLASVLDTIRSRSQIIMIREKSSHYKQQELLNIGFTEKESIFYAKISDTVDEAKKLKKDDYITYYENIVKILSKALIKPEIIFSDLAAFIKKANFKKFLLIINIFMNDIWKHEEEMETVTKDKDLLNKYFVSKFNYIEAIKLSGDFLLKEKSNVNFNLIVSDYLVKMWGLYE